MEKGKLLNIQPIQNRNQERTLKKSKIQKKLLQHKFRSMNIKQIKTNAGNIVLCDVQWSNAESRGYGACKNYTVHLEPFSNTLQEIIMKVVISKCEKVERRVLAVEEQEIFLGYLARTKRASVKWVDYDGKILKCVIVIFDACNSLNCMLLYTI